MIVINEMNIQYCKYCRAPGGTHESCKNAIIEYKRSKKKCKHNTVTFSCPNEYECKDCLKPLYWSVNVRRFIPQKYYLKTKNLLNYL